MEKVQKVFNKRAPKGIVILSTRGNSIKNARKIIIEFANEFTSSFQSI